MKTDNLKTADFSGVKDGETFVCAGIEFIKFPDVDGMTPAVSRKTLFNSRFGDNNDLRTSDVLERLKKEVLPKIVAAIGEENVCTFKTDLTTWDGLKPYGVAVEKISLPTMDFYRENVELFDKYPANSWWWLATPDSAQPHSNADWVLCVSPSGDIYGGCIFYSNLGVRPVLYLNSSIFGSSED